MLSPDIHRERQDDLVAVDVALVRPVLEERRRGGLATPVRAAEARQQRHHSRRLPASQAPTARAAHGTASAWATSTPTMSETNIAKRTGSRWSNTGRCAKAFHGSLTFGW